MSDAHDTHEVSERAFSTPVLVNAGAGVLMLIGLALFGISYAINKDQAWGGWIVGAWFALGMPLFAAFFLSINALSSGGWAATIKRVPEAMTRYFIPALLTFAVLAVGLCTSNVYEWTHIHDDDSLHTQLLKGKEPWLNPTMWIVRTLIYFGLWTGFTWAIVHFSRKQDSDGDIRHSYTIRKIAAPFCIVFGLSVTFASVDYLMSVEPTWFSTMFGVHQFAGMVQAGFAMLIVLLLILRNAGYLRGAVNENHFHNLGIWLLSTCVFWAYIWFCEFMLIWYANIPEETQHYFARWEGSWFFVSFVLNPLLNFAIPFLMLLPRPNKRNLRVLLLAALIALAGRFVDIWQFVAPGVRVDHDLHVPVAQNTPWEMLPAVGPALFTVGLFIVVVMKSLEKAPLLATKDPFFEEGLHHHL